jgi:ribosomal protein L11 methyltransferase
MPFLELSLILRAEQQEAVEAALEDVGALAVTLLDAEDHPIYEPAPGETPLWPTIVLSALFEEATDRAGIVHVLVDVEAGIAPEQITFREVADADWTRAWMDRYEPMRFGTRLWIYPSTIEPPDDPESVIVRLDPGLAFGTGTHPTTALCLDWLDGQALDGCDVIDYGCGSGVLAIAALALGAARVVGIDTDPQALDASADNAARNGFAGRLDLRLPDGEEPAPADVLVANILAGPLHALAPHLAALVVPGGRLALSGILAGQEADLLERYAEWFEGLRVTQREDWIRIDGRRRDAR